MVVLEQMAQTMLVIFFDEVTDVYDIGTELDRHFGKAFNVMPWEKLLVKLEKAGITEGCRGTEPVKKERTIGIQWVGRGPLPWVTPGRCQAGLGWYLSPEYILVHVHPVHPKFETSGFKNKCSILITVKADRFCGSPTPGPLLQAEISQLLLEMGKGRKSSTD